MLERFNCLVTACVLATALVSRGGASAACQRSTPALAAYVGKYPSDRVRGVTFRDHPKVVAAVTAAVSGVPADADVRDLALSPEHSVDAPILQLSSRRLFVRSYDPVGGGSTNWAILITGDGSKAAICYSDDAVYDDGVSHWYFMGKEAFRFEGACPSEQDAIEKSLGSWPVGPKLKRPSALPFVYNCKKGFS